MKKFKTKFQDEDFNLGEVVDVSLDGNYRKVIAFVNKDGGGNHTFYYKTIDDFYEDFEEVE